MVTFPIWFYSIMIGYLAHYFGYGSLAITISSVGVFLIHRVPMQAIIWHSYTDEKFARERQADPTIHEVYREHYEATEKNSGLAGCLIGMMIGAPIFAAFSILLFWFK